MSDQDSLLPHSNFNDRSIFWFLLLSTWSLGLNFAFSCEFAFATPLFKSLGLSSIATSLANFAGPVTGLITQPIVGYYSDRSTFKWGKRRIFIVIGVISGTLGLLVFGNSKEFGEAVSDEQSTSRSVAIVVAIVSLWALNIGLNIVQSPAWALTLDICRTSTEVTKGTASNTALSATGTLLANGLGYINIISILTFFKTNTQAMFYIGTGCLILAVIPTLVIGKERAGQRLDEQTPVLHADQYIVNNETTINNNNNNNNNDDDDDTVRETVVSSDIDSRRVASGWRAFYNSVRQTPRSIVKLCVAYFCSSAALSPYYFYFTDYVGANVFDGVANAKIGTLPRTRYDDGVRFGALGLALMAGVTLLTSLSLPLIQRALSRKQTYMAAHMIAIVAVSLPLFTFSRVSSMLAVATIGVLNSTYATIPFGMLSSLTGDDNVDSAAAGNNENGFYVGLLNIAQVIGQLVANLMCGVVMSVTDRVYSCFSVALFFVLIGLIAIAFLDKTK